MLDQLFSAQASKDNKNQDIKIIQQIVKNTIGNRLFHICNHCGFKARQHHWQCPACNSWETLSTELIDSTK